MRPSARIVPLGRRVVAERLVRPCVVVLVDVGGDEPPELGGRPALAYPHALRLEAAEPPLDDDVVDPAGLSVHALADAVAREEPLVGRRVEDRPPGRS